MWSGWIYDHLKPHAAAVKVAHPLMLRAIAAAKKKNDGVDANKICDCLRCDFLPECYMAQRPFESGGASCAIGTCWSAGWYRRKTRLPCCMEAGISYNKQRLHKPGYFSELLAITPEIDEGLRSLLRMCRETVVRLAKTESALVRSLTDDRLLVFLL